MTKLVPVYPDRWALVDDEDFEKIRALRWRLHRDGYALRRQRSNGRNGAIYMHRLVLSHSDLQTDHINGDPLDNRRDNLRAVSQSLNQQNRKGAQRNSTTGVRGVSVIRDKRRIKKGRVRYVAHVQIEGKQIHRSFPYTPAGFEAAQAAAIELRRRYHHAT